LTGQTYPGYTGTLPDDHLRALRKLLDEIEEESEFEARYGMPLNSLGINEQHGASSGGAAGEHWPKRPPTDSTPGSDRPGECDAEAVQHQRSDVVR
jgi:hypothetical protein